MFVNIVGNDKSKEVLKKIIKSDNISHSYIFSGKESIGKYLFAKEFAKGVLCLNKDKATCGICKSCLEMENLNNPDFFLIDSDENSIKIDKIREMNKTVLEKPIVSDRKVYIINNGDRMTKEAANSLLKTLEEPPEYVVIIIISSNDNMLLNTIKSRCTRINFNKLDDNEIREILRRMDINNISEKTMKIADGSVNRAINLKDKEEIYSNVYLLFSDLKNVSKIDIINSKETLFKDKEEIYNILEYINIIFSELIKDKPKEEYANCIQVIENTKERLNRNSNFDMTIDRMLIKLWETVQV